MSSLAEITPSSGRASTNAASGPTGPGRCLARKEPLFTELDYHDQAEASCLVLEVDKPPPPQLVERIAVNCGVAIEALTLILTPTGSLAGGVAHNVKMNARLRALPGVEAVHVGVSSANPGAIAFYRRLGFRDLHGGTVWGRSTDPA